MLKRVPHPVTEADRLSAPGAQPPGGLIPSLQVGFLRWSSFCSLQAGLRDVQTPSSIGWSTTAPQCSGTPCCRQELDACMITAQVRNVIPVFLNTHKLETIIRPPRRPAIKQNNHPDPQNRPTTQACKQDNHPDPQADQSCTQARKLAANRTITQTRKPD